MKSWTREERYRVLQGPKSAAWTARAWISASQQVGEVLDVPLESPLHTLRVFIDRSSAEYFFNDGEATFTAHACPTAREHSYTMTDGAPLRLWPLEGAVTNAFVL